MVRSLSAFAVLAAAAVVALSAPSCTAQVTESCSDGPCGGGAAALTSTETGPNAADCPATPQEGDFPCTVFAVVHKKCHPCHQMPPKNGAPFPLLTYADTQKPYATNMLVFHQMFISTGPDGSPRMPLGGALSESDYNLLHRWLGECAPPVPTGTGCSCPGPGCD